MLPWLRILDLIFTTVVCWAEDRRDLDGFLIAWREKHLSARNNRVLFPDYTARRHMIQDVLVAGPCQ